MFDFFKDPRVIWEPKPDITTYELALAMNVLSGTDRIYDLPKRWIVDLPKNVQRHFKDI